MDRTITRHDGIVFASLLAAAAGMAGVVLHPDTVWLPGWLLFGSFVAVLFSPDSFGDF